LNLLHPSFLSLENCTDFDPLRTHVSRDLNDTGTYIDDGLDRQVKSLPYSITKRYGEIVFAQGGTGYGWWPCQIYDPRHAIDPNVRHMAQKYLYSRYLVYFFNCTDISTSTGSTSNTTTTTATNHTNNSYPNGPTNNNNNTNISNATTNSSNNNTSSSNNSNNNSATGTSNPFSILGPKMIKSWIVGLSEDLYFGRAAKNHGKQRYRSFCDAFQLACIEYDKGNNKSIEHKLRPVLDSYLCQASNRDNTINLANSNNNLQFETKNVRHDTFLKSSPRKNQSKTYHSEKNFTILSHLEKDTSSSTNVDVNQQTSHRKRIKKYRFRRPNKRHHNSEVHNAVVDVDVDDYVDDSDEPHPAFDGLILTADVVQESLVGRSTSKNPQTEFSTTMIDGDESIVYHIESSSSPHDHDMMIQSKILVNPLVSNNDKNAMLSANMHTALYGEKLKMTSEFERQCIVHVDEGNNDSLSTAVFPITSKTEATILESEYSKSNRKPEQTEVEYKDRFGNVSTSIHTEVKTSCPSQSNMDKVVTSITDSCAIQLQVLETSTHRAHINVSEKLEGDRLQQQQSKESITAAKRQIGSLDESMVPESVKETGESVVEAPCFIRKKVPKGQKPLPHVQVQTNESMVEPMLESCSNSKTICDTSLVDDEESLITSIIADAMTEIEEEQVMQSKTKHKRPILDNQYTWTKAGANSVSLFAQNSCLLKAGFEESTKSSGATDTVVYGDEEKRNTKKKGRPRKYIDGQSKRHEQVHISILSLSPSKVIPKFAIDQAKTLTASFQAANYFNKSKHTTKPRGRPRKSDHGSSAMNSLVSSFIAKIVSPKTKGHTLQSQPRKRGRPKKVIEESLSNSLVVDLPVAKIDNVTFPDKPCNISQPKCNRGRPRKVRSDDEVQIKPKGKRGRPKKEKPFGVILHEQPARKRGRPPKIRDDRLYNLSPSMELPFV
jgi:hypothetical protein